MIWWTNCNSLIKRYILNIIMLGLFGLKTGTAVAAASNIAIKDHFKTRSIGLLMLAEEEGRGNVITHQLDFKPSVPRETHYV